MKSFPEIALVFIVPFLMAIGCLTIAASLMEGLQDCRPIHSLSHTIPSSPFPDNCADDQTLLDHDVLAYTAMGLFVVPFVTAAIIGLRKEQEKDGVVETLKISAS